MRLGPLDLGVIASYFILVSLMGFYFAGRVKSTADFFLASRGIRSWAIGLSILAANISSISFIAIPADSFRTSWIRWLTELLRFPIGVPLVAFFVIPLFFRRALTFTAYQYLEERFGPSIRLYASGAFILDQILRVSVISYLLGVLLSQAFGYDLSISIVCVGVFLAFYTNLGGIRAVVWTDVAQVSIFLTGTLLGIILIIIRLPGGLREIITTGLAYHKLSFDDLVGGRLVPISWDLTLQRKTVAMLMLLGLTAWLQSFCCGQDMVQRYSMAKSVRDARRALVVGALVSVVISILFYGFGTALFAFYHRFPDAVTQGILAGSGKAEQIVPHFVLTQMPPGLVGLMVAAILAAAMASLDSSFNASSMVITTDIYRRFVKTNASERHYLLFARACSTTMALIMLCGGLQIMKASTKTLLDTVVQFASLISGGLLGLYILGFLTRRGDARSAWCGIAATGAFATWALVNRTTPYWLPDHLRTPFEFYYVGIVGNALSFLIGYCASYLLRGQSRHSQAMTIWDARHAVGDETEL